MNFSTCGRIFDPDESAKPTGVLSRHGPEIRPASQDAAPPQNDFVAITV